MAFSAFHIVYEYMERRPFPHFYGDSRRVLALGSTLRIKWSPLHELEQVMQKKFKANTSLRASQVGGVDAAARIMNFTKQNMEARIMKDIAKGDKGLMQAIQESMFVFDTLIMSDDKSLQTLLRMVDTELLVLALKGADEPLQEKLFACMSKRAAANIIDEMEALGPVRLTEVQGAQKEIINVARRLSDEGTIVLAGRGGDDFV